MKSGTVGYFELLASTVRLVNLPSMEGISAPTSPKAGLMAASAKEREVGAPPPWPIRRAARMPGQTAVAHGTAKDRLSAVGQNISRHPARSPVRATVAEVWRPLCRSIT